MLIANSVGLRHFNTIITKPRHWLRC